MLFILALISAFPAVFLLNSQGSYTNSGKLKLLSVLANLVSVTLFVQVYGLARGVFVYLAVIAIVGLVVTALTSKPKHS